MSDSRESFTIGNLDSLPLHGTIMPMSKRFNPRAENLKKMNNTQGGFFSPRITTADQPMFLPRVNESNGNDKDHLWTSRVGSKESPRDFHDNRFNTRTI